MLSGIEEGGDSRATSENVLVQFPGATVGKEGIAEPNKDFEIVKGYLLTHGITVQEIQRGESIEYGLMFQRPVKHWKGLRFSKRLRRL